MKLFDWFSNLFQSINSFDNYSGSSTTDDYYFNHDQTSVNPATGMSMTGSIDIHGNPFGTSSINTHFDTGISQSTFNDPIHHHDPFQDSFCNPLNDFHNSSFNDPFQHDSFSNNSFNDPFKTW